MAYFDEINESLFKLGDLSTLQSRDITQSIIDMSVSLTMGGSSQVSVQVVDPNFGFAKANYFQIRRDLFYRDMWFEISAVEVSRSDSVHPLYSLECRSKAVQLMKRDKKPEAYRGMTGYDFAQAMAKRFNMNFVGERTTKKQSIVKGKSKDSDDSVWTVMQSLAGEQKFVCFEAENTLFFCSEKFLLGKWGDPTFSYGDFKFIPFIYPEPSTSLMPSAKDKYVLLDMPRVRRSDDDIKAADGSMIVDRLNGVKLRPGQTIFLGGIPDFESFYLITDVSFKEGSPDPVQVQFRVPVDPTKEKISTGGTRQGGSSNSTTGSSTLNPPGSGKIKLPTGRTTASAKTYAREALQYLNYRGTNGALMINAVYVAVTNIQNNKTPNEAIALINASKKLDANQKSIVLKIFYAFLTGAPSSKFAVKGGITDTEAERLRRRTQEELTPTGANPTPTNTSAPQGTASAPSLGDRVTGTGVNSNATGTTGGFGSTSSAQGSMANAPARNLPVAINAKIGTYIDTHKPSGFSGDLYKVKIDVNAVAKAIWLQPDIQLKATSMNRYYSIWKNKADNFKYNALRLVWSQLAGSTTGANSVKIPDAYR